MKGLVLAHSVHCTASREKARGLVPVQHVQLVRSLPSHGEGRLSIIAPPARSASGKNPWQWQAPPPSRFGRVGPAAAFDPRVKRFHFRFYRTAFPRTQCPPPDPNLSSSGRSRAASCHGVQLCEQALGGNVVVCRVQHEAAPRESRRIHLRTIAYPAHLSRDRSQPPRAAPRWLPSQAPLASLS